MYFLLPMCFELHSMPMYTKLDDNHKIPPTLFFTPKLLLKPHHNPSLISNNPPA
jgi:hypothetical protein